MVGRHHVGPRAVVDEAHGVVGRQPGRGVAGVVDAGRVGLAVGGVVGVGDGEVVALGVRHLVERPVAGRGLALRQDARVGGVAELHDLAGLGLDLEPGRPGAGGAERGNLGEALDLGAVLGAVGAVGAADGEEALAVEAETVVGVVFDGAAQAVLGQGARTAADGGQAVEHPAHAEEAVAGLAAVGQRQGWEHAGGARRHGNRDGIGRSPRGADPELARHRHALRHRRRRPKQNRQARSHGGSSETTFAQANAQPNAIKHGPYSPQSTQNDPETLRSRASGKSHGMGGVKDSFIPAFWKFCGLIDLELCRVHAAGI